MPSDTYMPPMYSFVIPIFNEEDTIDEMLRRLTLIAEGLDGEVEIVLVDDGSRDRSLEMLRQANKDDAAVRYISLARNFGHQIAVTAGLRAAEGEAVIVMDADLQDPPELIPAMVDKWKEGYQVVYAQRTSRRTESFLKRSLAYLFYRVLRVMTDVDIPS